MKNLIILFILSLFMVACATDYPCGEPRTGRCSSISENYERSNQPIINPEDKPINPHENCQSGNCGNNSNNGSTGNSSGSWFSSSNKDRKSNLYPQIPANGSPLVSTPSMMRVWISPYVDADNIYHDQGYQYMLVDRGHWLFGANDLFGRSKSFKQLTTTLYQDSNPSAEDRSNDTPQKTGNNGVNNANTTPALNYLKQQDQSSVSSLGLGKQ